jgi:acyl CoA:acetate/3-ketoacid CoA transferase alpha subunit
MNYQLNNVSLEEASSKVKSGDRVFIQGAAMTPYKLIDGLVSRYESLNDVEIIHLHTEGQAAYTEKPYRGSYLVS